MKLFTCTSTGQPITLTNQIAKSGEGEVWQTDFDGCLAKVYYSADPLRIRKLEVMIAHPPRDPNAGINHISFAWPKSLLQDGSGAYVGFLMPEITRSVQLIDVYNPLRRQRVLPGFNWLYLHTAAMNIASIIGAIHQAGYVVGDIKPENILVSDRALPAVIDADSFQVRHPQTGDLFHCLVGSEGFTPVELLGKDLATTEQTVIHDRFRLGVIIHLLLFGDYPFKGKWTGAGDSPTPNELLRQGFWCYAPNSLVQPGPLTIPLKTVHPAVQECFLRCFNAGHLSPELRPTPAEWMNALDLARVEIVACKKVKNHYYSKTYGKCYWCDRKATLGVDIFPGVMPPPSNHPVLKALKQTRSTLEKQLKQWNTPQLTAKLKPAMGSLLAVKATVQSLGSSFAGQPPMTKGSNFPPVNLPPTNFPTTNFPSSNFPLTILPKPSSTAQPTIQPMNGQIAWKWMGGAIAILTAIFAILLFLSRSHVDTQEVELTVVGIVLCLGLVAIGFLWLKVMSRYNL